jgi:uncharacterized membrane protein
MASYRRRLEQDLDGWIARGLVPPESREGILESVGEGRRLDAATALAIIGALMAGVAVIAFVAANWSAIPRLARFALILAAFLGASGGAAWASARGRPTASHALLSVAALVFAAAIGLTGQIFDIAGDPQTALRAAGVAAALLALAGRSPWAGVVGLAMLAFGDFVDPRLFGADRAWAGWLVVAAPVAAVTALFWRSQALAHAAGLAAILAVLTFDPLMRDRSETLFLAAAGVLAVGAAAGRWARERFEGPAGVLYGWLAWGALFWFGVAGFDEDLRGVAHSVGWLALAGAAVALGRHDRHAGVTSAGVVGLLAAGATLLFNLGVGLMTSAAVFAGAALIALAVAFALRRRRVA